MTTKLRLANSDLQELLSQAPAAVESYFPGHWGLMAGLKQRAREIVRDKDREAFVRFLCEVAFLKQPREDHAWLQPAIEKKPQSIELALDVLEDVERLDYRAMEVLAEVPGFGQGGGRSFNSAVMRLVRPQSFGIIDWRNLAVLMSAQGFEGLVAEPLSLEQLSPAEVLRLRGRLVLTQQIYERYNDSLREIALSHAISVADSDLVLWTFSIQKRPFSPFQPRQTVKHPYQISTRDRGLLRAGQRSQVAKRIVDGYLAGLSESADVSANALADELIALFALIRNECILYAARKPAQVRQKVSRVVRAFDIAIEAHNLRQLLRLWSNWNELVDPASPNWIGIGLPASMVLEGYLILEDFIELKQFVESQVTQKV